MAKKKTAKKVAKDIKKFAKKNPKSFAAIVIVLIILLALGVGGYFVYMNFFYKAPEPEIDLDINGPSVMSLSLNGSEYVEQGATATYGELNISAYIETKIHEDTNDGNVVSTISVNEEKTYYVEYTVSYNEKSETKYRTVNVTDVEGISITFLELGNYHTGDSTYIKAGSNDILIDAGSAKDSADDIFNYLVDDSRVGDDLEIEYLIVTHAHQDHIAALVGSKDNPGLFDRFKFKTIIQFSQTTVTSQLYQDYCTKRDAEVASGATLYYVNDLITNHNNVFDIAVGTKLTILDQKFYYEKSSDENNHSVCTLITQNENNYLFTGDLEKAGEESLVEKNTLPHCQLFKGGHHGSPTSSNECLLSVIQPEVVCICCCAGNDEYTDNVNNQFPSQAAINRFAVYTDQIFVTTVTTDGHTGYKSMNGYITFTCLKGQNYTVVGSNNSVILKDTDWFKSNRTWPTA